MSNVTITDPFDVPPDKASTRLFFAKQHPMDRFWHICDASLGRPYGRHIFYMALHGSYMFPTDRADTVLQADILRAPTDKLCQRCLDEYILAVDIINRKDMIKFD